MSLFQRALTGALVAVVLVAVVCGAGCGEPEGEFAITTPDYTAFETQVMPVLARDCSFHTCHGARQRFFQVLGPGRPRLSPLSLDSDPLTTDELRFNYERARSMIDRDNPERSPLFMKPLEPGAGGAGHEGTDLFGRDVYESRLDPSFLVLQSWVLSAPPAAPLVRSGRAPTQPPSQPTASQLAPGQPGGP